MKVSFLDKLDSFLIKPIPKAHWQLSIGISLLDLGLSNDQWQFLNMIHIWAIWENLRLQGEHSLHLTRSLIIDRHNL